MEQHSTSAKHTILVAEDEEAIRESIAEVLSDEGYQVAAVADGRAGMEAVDQGEFDLVLSDLRMPGADGMELLRHVRAVSPQSLVLLMTAHATIESAVAAIRHGAHDYLLKPVDFDDLLRKIEHLLEHRQVAWEYQTLRTQLDRQWDFQRLVGRSAAMHEVMNLVRRVAPAPTTVLITGESGVGKEVIARAIHHYSDNRSRVFLPVNCGAIPETLLESQLFGHIRGAFTGASTNQEGLFQRARGGTIFLDEIGEMPINLQVKLLRGIEEKEVLPVGATTPVKVDIRIIAATNRDLAQLVQVGSFRADLFYRLNILNIEVPPLRERREDIPVLVDHFVHMLNRELKKNYQGVDSTTMKLLLSLPWKGNVRELANVIEHAMILGEGEWIQIQDLPRVIRQDHTPLPETGDELRGAVRAFEKAHIEMVLARTHDDKKEAADRLGVSLSSLYRKIDELGIGREGEVR